LPDSFAQQPRTALPEEAAPRALVAAQGMMEGWVGVFVLE
jgi:hypothetical protein